jgi:hypothetical protein
MYWRDALCLDGSVNRSLNRGMRYALRPAGPTTKSGCFGRLIEDGVHGAALGSIAEK